MKAFFKFVQYYFSDDKYIFLALRNILGFYPCNIHIYKQCLRHRSASVTLKNGSDNSNERLEFLGDAVLGASVAHYLFSKFPYKDEGYLTKIRARIVSRNNLNFLSRKIGLTELMEVKKDNHFINKSAAGDTLEAFIGAVYMDKGYKAAHRFVINKLIKIHLDIDEILNNDTDYKSKLVEWSQKEKKELQYEIASEVGNGPSKYYIIDLYVDGEKKSSGTGNSKKSAEQSAAEKFLAELDYT
ncbi:MAG: ribonuclease III [Bacteroidia bacterium]|nr:ribonuclease III [Bacteroidia bacterium]